MSQVAGAREQPAGSGHKAEREVGLRGGQGHSFAADPLCFCYSALRSEEAVLEAWKSESNDVMTRSNLFFHLRGTSFP